MGLVIGSEAFIGVQPASRLPPINASDPFLSLGVKLLDSKFLVCVRYFYFSSVSKDCESYKSAS